MSIAGVLAVPYVIGEFTAGRITLPSISSLVPGSGLPGTPGVPGRTGNVAPGTVAFGSSISLQTCTLSGQTIVAGSNDPIYWLAQFTRRTSPTDQVRLRVTLDGTEILDEVQARGAYDCLGVDTPEVGLSPGIYSFEVSINGSVDARGTLFVS
jgi:hypothetical protein